MKELIIKMPNYLEEVNELYCGKQLHSALDMGCLKTGDRKRNNVSNKKSHALFQDYDCNSVELWMTPGQTTEHLWQWYNLSSQFVYPTITCRVLGVSFHLQFIITKISYLHCSIFNTPRWVICGGLRLLDWGFQMPTHVFPPQYPFTGRAVNSSETFLCLYVNNYSFKNVIGEPGVPLIHGFF